MSTRASIRIATLLATLLASFTSSCATHAPRTRAPRGLEAAFFLVEEPHRAAPIVLSGEPGTSTVTRVVENAEVDVDSVIQVGVDAARLASEAVPGRSGDVEKLETEKSTVVRLLGLYGEWLAARAGVLDAFAQTLKLSPAQLADAANPTVAAFVTARDASDASDVQKTALITGLIEVYGENDAKFDQLEKIALDTALPGLDDFLNGEVAALTDKIKTEREMLAARSVAGGNSATLRLEAFLLSKDADPRAIHLPKYDSLDAERVEITHSALDLSVAELARLATVARDMAAAAESVRRHETSLDAAVRQVSPKLADRIGALQRELEKLRDETTSDALSKLVDESQRALTAFIEKAWKDLEATAESEAGKARDSFRTSFGADIALVRGVFRTWVELLAAVDSLLALLRPFDAKELPDIIAAADKAYAKASGLLAEIRAIAADAPELHARFRAELEKDLVDLPEEVQARIVAAWKESFSKRALGAWVELYARSKAVLAQAQVLLSLGDVVPLSLKTTVPEAFEVPVASAEPTSIDLTRTRRKVGDQVVLRATLTPPAGTMAGGKPVEAPTMDAHFDVERFGWHDSLEPSIVLVEPDRLPGSDGDVRFAPAIVWAWSYYPRADEEGWWVDSARLLEPSAGIHAILVDFDDENSTEIGLGATFSLWENRLQFGIGWNLMADSDRDGGTYYYIGSSLIPLLQALGDGG